MHKKTFVAPPVLIIGLPGVGKSWILSQLLSKRAAAPLECTTRPSRPEDESTVNYLHITDELFAKLEMCGAFTAQRYRNRAYGSIPTVYCRGNARTPIFLVDCDTARAVYSELPCHIVALIAPRQALEERLNARTNMTDEHIARRLEETGHQLKPLAELAKYTIVNIDADQALAELEGIIDRTTIGSACLTCYKSREIAVVLNSFSEPNPNEQTAHTLDIAEMASIQDEIDALYDTVIQDEIAKRKHN